MKENELDTYQLRPAYLYRCKRIAVILPIGYSLEVLRNAKLLAQALLVGSRKCNEEANIVFAHLDNNEFYTEADFSDMDSKISRRSFKWKTLSASESRRAMRYAGHHGWEPMSKRYLVPDDGIKQLLDCDLWIFISDQLAYPILPIRPYLLIVDNYLQRYFPIMPHGKDQRFLDAARKSRGVLVTTEFTRQDALQYAGINKSSVFKVPMLVPDFSSEKISQCNLEYKYFLWKTNASIHKNHENAIKALDIYYRELNGQLKCRVTEERVTHTRSIDMPHLKFIRNKISENKVLQENINWQGELSNSEYKQQLASAQFLWHPAKIDNGTFSVIEATYVGIPSLSSDYPAMREIDQTFSLNMNWMNADDPQQMAKQLKWMELNISKCQEQLPTIQDLQKMNVESMAKEYWEVVRECL